MTCQPSSGDTAVTWMRRPCPTDWWLWISQRWREGKGVDTHKPISIHTPGNGALLAPPKRDHNSSEKLSNLSAPCPLLSHLKMLKTTLNAVYFYIYLFVTYFLCLHLIGFLWLQLGKDCNSSSCFPHQSLWKAKRGRALIAFGFCVCKCAGFLGRIRSVSESPSLRECYGVMSYRDWRSDCRVFKNVLNLCVTRVK